jgi:hypothetical protein
MNEKKRYEVSTYHYAQLVSLFVHVLILIFFFYPFLTTFKKPDFQAIFVAFEYTESPEDLEIADTNIENNVSTQQNAATSPARAANVSNNPAAPSASQLPKAMAEEAPIAGDNAKQQDVAIRKKSFSDLFKKESGNNIRGDNQEAATDGSDALDGLEVTRGTGRVSGGLAGRGVVFTPSFTDTSQKTGRVALEICVDAKGNVVSSVFTQRGSSTSDNYLISLARKSSLQYKFSPGEASLQCGILQIEFKVQ